MGLLKSAEGFPVFLLPCKDRQVILIDVLFLMVVVFPDEAAVIPVFSDRGIPDHCFIFIKRIKIKNEDPSRIQIILNQ